MTPLSVLRMWFLGMPGWDANNGNESYYDNSRYFRPGRGKNR